MDELRTQCPWDKKQTIESLRHLTIEEVYELSDAILDNNLEEVKKELGDIMLHLIFYSRSRKSPSFEIPSKIARTASDSSKASSSNDFSLVCVVRTDGSKKSPNGSEVRNNW